MPREPSTGRRLIGRVSGGCHPHAPVEARVTTPHLHPPTTPLSHALEPLSQAQTHDPAEVCDHMSAFLTIFTRRSSPGPRPVGNVSNPHAILPDQQPKSPGIRGESHPLDCLFCGGLARPTALYPRATHPSAANLAKITRLGCIKRHVKGITGDIGSTSKLWETD